MRFYSAIRIGGQLNFFGRTSNSAIARPFSALNDNQPPEEIIQPETITEERVWPEEW